VDFLQIKGRVDLREPGLEVVVQIFNLDKQYGPLESSKLGGEGGVGGKGRGGGRVLRRDVVYLG
jgi:hypothetical protein